jgi:hypothetical protein
MLATGSGTTGKPAEDQVIFDKLNAGLRFLYLCFPLVLSNPKTWKTPLSV